jgi:hypothetical protein
LLGVAALFFSGQAVFAQKTESSRLAHRTKHVATIAHKASASGELRAVVFPSGDPLKVKVCFENPALERVVLMVKDDTGTVVYSGSMGRSGKYVGLIDLSALGDGDYTVLLRSKSGRYVQPFQLRTETSRLAFVQ